MPLEPTDQQFFDAACGYAQLGMYLDANEELEKVDPYRRAAPENAGISPKRAAL